MNYTQEAYLNMIDTAFDAYLPSVSDGQDYVREAMRYSLKNGGKRIRPILTLEFCRLCAGAPEQALPFACALEMIHTYSLIHDDLPCMDDDDMRRGKPACHKAYGEAYALLAGDGLLTLAFETAARAETVSARNVKNAILTLSHLAGISGMIGGQVLDLQAEKTQPDLDKLQTIDRLKTGALIRAAVLLGCYASEQYDDKLLQAATVFAEKIGLAFQIVDDVLDVTSDTQTLGKPVGSDDKNEKITYVQLLGIDESKKTAERLTEEAVSALSAFPGDTAFLTDLATRLACRKK